MNQARRRGCAGLASLTAIVVVIACVVAFVVVRRGGSTPSGPPATSSSASRPRVAPTGWAKISQLRDGDGQLTLEGAQQAFAYQFEPLPGVTPLAGLTPTPALWSGTETMRAVLRHWTELTDAQRAVIGRYLGSDGEVPEPAGQATTPGTGGTTRSGSTPGTAATSGTGVAGLGSSGDPGAGSTPARWAPVGPGGGGATASPGHAWAARPVVAADVSTTTTSSPPPDPALGPRLLAELRADAAGENARLGGDYPNVSHVRLVMSRTEYAPEEGEQQRGTGTAAWTIALSGNTLVDEHNPTLPVDGCRVFIPPSTWQTVPPGNAPIPPQLSMYLAHEAFHCMQGFFLGRQTGVTFLTTPDWVLEGSAEWAGNSYLGESLQDNWWNTYEDDPTVPLPGRDYDALGVFYLVEQLHRPLWPAWVSIWKSVASDPTTSSDHTKWLQRVTGPVAGAFADTWGSSVFHVPEWGDAWHNTSATHTGESGLSTPVHADITQTIPALSPALFAIGSGPGSVVVLHGDAPFRWRDTDGQEKAGVHSVALCLSSSDSCRCPDGSPAGKDVPMARLPFAAGVSEVTGKAGGFEIKYRTLDDHCQHDKPDGAPAGGREPGSPGGQRPEGGPTGSGGGGGCDSCGSDAGEPHVTTIDGVRYDFMAAGEFTALAGGDGFEVQTRQEMLGTRTDVSLNTAAALDVMGDHIGFYATKDALRFHHDGHDEVVKDKTTLSHGGTVTADAGGASIMWPDGSRVWVIRVGSSTPSVNVLAHVTPARQSRATGLMGATDHGQVSARDGTKITPSGGDPSSSGYRDLYRTFGDSWRVTASSSLFDYESGTSAGTYDRRDLPDAAKTIDQFSADDRKRGEDACAGISDRSAHDECVFDVAITGDTANADGYRAIEAVLHPAGTIKPGDTIADRTISANTVDQYRIEVDHPGQIYLRHGDHNKDEHGDLMWTLYASDGTKIKLTGLDFDIESPEDAAPAGTYTLAVRAGPDSKATYGFSVIGVTPAQDFTINVGDTVSVDHPDRGAGFIDNWGAKDRYTFTANSGDQLVMDPRDCNDGSGALAWEIVRSNGDHVASGPMYCDSPSDPVAIPDDGSYTIVVTANDTGLTSYGGLNGKRFDGRYGFNLRRS